MSYTVRLDDCGVFDELLAEGAVHVERMDRQAVWMWIDMDRPGGGSLSIRTGVEDGVWYFRVDEAWIGGKTYVVEEGISNCAKGSKR